MAKFSGKCPDGTTTTKSAEYIKAWYEVIHPFEELTGWKCFSFDPGISLRDAHWNRSVNLPPGFFQALLAGIRKTVGWSTRLDQKPDQVVKNLGRVKKVRKKVKGDTND